MGKGGKKKNKNKSNNNRLPAGFTPAPDSTDIQESPEVPVEAPVVSPEDGPNPVQVCSRPFFSVPIAILKLPNV